MLCLIHLGAILMKMFLSQKHLQLWLMALQLTDLEATGWFENQLRTGAGLASPVLVSCTETLSLQMRA